MDLFLKFDDGFKYYGYGVLRGLIQDESNPLWSSKYFPRVVECNLTIKQSDKEMASSSYTFNCGLPANVFNEKIFLVLWAWFIIVLILNTFGLVKWLIKILRRRQTMKKYLSFATRANNPRKYLLRSFIEDYVNIDGFFLLQMIDANLNHLYTRRVIECLWKTYSGTNPLADNGFHTPSAKENEAKKNNFNDTNSFTPNVVPSSR
jgi:hypothetical protein